MKYVIEKIFHISIFHMPFSKQQIFVIGLTLNSVCHVVDQPNLHRLFVAGYVDLGLLLDGHVIDLDVGDGGVEATRPVDQEVAAVDQAPVVKADEGLVYRVAVSLAGK